MDDDFRLKYAIVLSIAAEKLANDGITVSKLEFTPDSDFMDTPIYDCVSAVLEIISNTLSGKYKPIIVVNL